MGKAIGWIIGLLVVVGAAALVFKLVDVDVDGDLKAPRVSVDGGEVPDVDVDVADVDVGSKEVEVKVPDVDVDVKDETITVPTIEIDEEADAEADDPQSN